MSAHVFLGSPAIIWGINSAEIGTFWPAQTAKKTNGMNNSEAHNRGILNLLMDRPKRIAKAININEDDATPPSFVNVVAVKSAKTVRT